MTSQRLRSDSLSLQVENIGGISETSVDLSRGTTLLEGRNATNRTSLLRALMAAMGSDRFSLKGNAEDGRVRLTFDETVVERRFRRRDGSIEAEGEGYLDDPELADTFAFLLEHNEARRAVERGDDLREIITRPIDTDRIEANIEQLEAEKRGIDERLETIDERQSELPRLEQRKTRLESEIEEYRERLAELEADIEAADADLEETREEKSEKDDRLGELRDLRSQLDDVRFQLETTRETIDSLENEREEKRGNLEELSAESGSDIDTLRDELDDLREAKREVAAVVSELGSIIEFNEEMLDGTSGEVADALHDDHDDSGTVTDELLETQTPVVCWSCGSEVDRDSIEETLARLRSLRKEKMSERRSLQTDIEDKQEQVSEFERNRREVERLESRIEEIDAELDRKRDRVEELEDRRETLREEVEELEAAIEDQDTSDYSELLDLHKEATEVGFELEQAEEDLASIEERIADIEVLADEREEQEQRRAEISERLTELRNRITRLETEAVEAFNEHIDEVLDVLDYENIARIWIERTERETREGRRTVTRGQFDLHVVRESPSGETYEGSIDTLSESEREVTGLVFALAGYLVHDLHESVPVMVLDSLEAIDSERIARLVDYFSEYSDFLVVAVLPEDAQAIDTADDTVTEI